MSPDEQPIVGLRERKKAKTKAAIQHHALRLFKAQGYDATTVEQIAEAAEISPSTFFRYFPSKEEVVLYDDLDPLFIAAFEEQPPELTPLEALRRALHQAMDHLPAEVLREQEERTKLMLTVPDLRQRWLDQVISTVGLTARMVAKRVGRSEDDLAVLTFAGATIGALISPFLGMLDASAPLSLQEILEKMYDSLSYLEKGLPL